jgi:hypothetical protein
MAGFVRKFQDTSESATKVITMRVEREGRMLVANRGSG